MRELPRNQRSPEPCLTTHRSVRLTLGRHVAIIINTMKNDLSLKAPEEIPFPWHLMLTSSSAHPPSLIGTASCRQCSGIVEARFDDGDPAGDCGTRR